MTNDPITARILRFRNHFAVVAAAIWLFLLWSDFVIARPLVDAVLLLGMYALTCWSLIYLHRQRLELNVFSRSAGMIALASLAVVTWSNVINIVPFGLPIPSYPVWLSFLSLLLPCAVATLATAAILLVPASLLLRNFAWVPPVLGCVIAFAIADSWPNFAARGTIGEAIYSLESVAFATLPALILHLLSDKLRAAFRAT